MRVGIIGCGGIARAHVRVFRALGAEIAGVTDCRPEAAEKLAAEVGGAVYADHGALLDRAGVQAVSVCTPPVAHEEAAVAALARGVHVLCEKPMAFDAAGARRMAAAAAQSAAILMPAFRHRFLPANIALRALVTDGTLGDVVFFNNVFCGPAFGMEGSWFTKRAIAGGGCLLDTNSHSVDLFRFIVGEITEQHAVMHRHFRTTDVEDAGILIIKAENGAVGALQSAFVAGVGAAVIDVMGTRGRAIYDYDEADKLRVRLTSDADWSVRAVAPSDGFAEEVTHFLSAVRGEASLSCTAHDGVRVMEVIDAAYAEQQ